MTPPKIERRCSCRGWIKAELPVTEMVIEAAVRDHQRTPRHREWWSYQEAADDRDLRFPVAVVKRVA